MARSQVTDRELLLRCRSGDRDAYGVFFARHRLAILGYLAHRTPAPEIAADLMAETFASVLADLRDSRSPVPEAPAAWLFTIARNLLIDGVRRGKVDAAARARLALEPMILDDEDIARVLEIASAADRFDEVAACLPATEWELLRARLVEEVPYPELAARLQCSEAVVRKRVSRRTAHVRAAYGESHG
jgi:RNA polymerase sigma-70 factor (ECF subfamily)